MKRARQLIPLFLLAALPAAFCATAATKPVQVFILAGQSNMEGHGFVPADPKRNGGKGSLEFVTNDPATAKHFAPLVDSAGQWRTRDDVWISYLDRNGPLTVGYGARREMIGPELGFGWVMGDALDEPVLLIKCAWGGKSLAVDFRPPSAGKPPYSLGQKNDAAIAQDPTIIGKYYRETLALTKAALANLNDLVPGSDGSYVLAGFAWHQGWNDRINDKFNAEYETNMVCFIRDIRKDLGASALPLVIAETGMTGPEEKNLRALSLMKAQAAVAEHPEFKGNVAFVATRAFWRPEDQSPSKQGYHWNSNAETYYLIGEAMGQAMRQLQGAKAASLAALPAAPVGVGAKPTALADDVVQSPSAGSRNFPLLGKIKTRSAKQVASSIWSIGGETLDRDFGIYANYKKFLGPLGAKAIRLQTGWAKCETKPGVYDFAWLDEIVDDAIAQGVQPWLEVSYGNRLYPDGGGTGLGGALPKSPQALTAWDNWVRAVVRRYQDRVKEWEVWNEPDLGPSPAEEYAEFFIRTAEVIRGEQPIARIYALALAHKVPYAESFLARVHQRGKLALINAITIHSYPNNPDDTRNIDELRAIIARHGQPIAVRQGETGATSKFQENFALKNLPMTETIQAKWNLRRMLAHHGKDVPFNLFTMIDLHYRWGGKLDMNYKGLLASREDQTVAYAKPAYFAAQNVFAIFDDSLVRLANFTCTASVTNAVAAFAYASKSRGQVVTLWFKGAMPSDSNAKTLVDFTFSASRFTTPVYADLRTGEVYSIPQAHWSRVGDGVVLRQIPIYDSPILITEKGVLALETTMTP